MHVGGMQTFLSPHPFSHRGIVTEKVPLLFFRFNAKRGIFSVIIVVGRRRGPITTLIGISPCPNFPRFPRKNSSQIFELINEREGRGNGRKSVEDILTLLT